MRPGQIHLHTRASDGDVTPAMVARARLGFVGVTDHDTVEGWDEFRGLARLGIEVVRGVELSTVFRGRHLHVLVLDAEPRPGFDACLAELARQRRARLEGALERLGDLGLSAARLDRTKRPIPTKRELGAAVLAEPANRPVLDRLGIDSLRGFRRRFFDEGSADPGPVGLPAEEVLPLAGGALVLAHPADSLRLPEEAGVVRDLARELPLLGMEVRTRKHDPGGERESARLARELDLVGVTSNDAHSARHLESFRTPPRQLRMLRERME